MFVTITKQGYQSNPLFLIAHELRKVDLLFLSIQ